VSMKTAKTEMPERFLSLNSLSFLALASMKWQETEEGETPKADAVSMTVSPYRRPDMPRRALARITRAPASICQT